MLALLCLGENDSVMVVYLGIYVNYDIVALSVRHCESMVSWLTREAPV